MVKEVDTSVFESNCDIPVNCRDVMRGCVALELKKMRIYTTYFSNVINLPNNIAPVSIALKPPKDWSGFQYRVLAPKEEFFYKWRENRDNEYYIEHFEAEVLAPLDASEVVGELFKLAEPYASIALVCYELPNEFCHRHLVARWLQQYGFEVAEFT